MAIGKNSRMRRGDVLILTLVLIAGLLLLGFSYWQSQSSIQGATLVVTNTATDTRQVYPLGKDARFTVEGVLGDSTIEIQDGKARFVSSPCPDQICIHVFDWIEKEYQLSFCLPNQILLEVQE